jgi:hypothetical protein
MTGTAEVKGIETWSPKDRPDITLACGDCRARVDRGRAPELMIGLADVRTVPFGAACQLHRYFFKTPPLAATNALALHHDDVASAVRYARAAAEGDSVIVSFPGAPVEAPSNTIFVGEDRGLPSEQPVTFSFAKPGPVTMIAANLLAAWSHGDPDKINPPDQSVAAAVDYATRLVALTGGK